MQSYERRYASEDRGSRPFLRRAQSITISPGWLIFLAGFLVGAWLF